MKLLVVAFATCALLSGCQGGVVFGGSGGGGGGGQGLEVIILTSGGGGGHGGGLGGGFEGGFGGGFGGDETVVSGPSYLVSTTHHVNKVDHGGHVIGAVGGWQPWSW